MVPYSRGKNLVQQRVAVDGVVERLPHSDVVERRVQREVQQECRRAVYLCDLQVWVLRKYWVRM